MTPPSSAWFLRPLPREDAKARLFCFPHAGVGASTYRLWPGGLPEALDVWSVQAPGRENRLREAPIASIPDLVRALLPQLLPALDRPFAFFGHSMGAVVAVEVARALQDAGARLPSQLIVSGRRPPHVRSIESPMHRLSDEAFITEINRRYGGIHPEILRHPDLLALLLPGLRADITALETHHPLPRPPLSFPVSALGGTDDSLTPREHLDAWRGETTGAFRVRVFPGGHFYVDSQRAALLADLSVTLAPLLAGPLAAERSRS